ncbi:MAG: hypothetical protein JNK05_36805 [Myxococcales bacterium]|nr:hypothetical protein [Myxococcales bacterium]
MKLELDLPEARVFFAEDVLVLWWRQAPTLPAVQRISETIERVTRHRSSNTRMLVVTSATMKAPDSEAREAMMASNRRTASKMAAVALAIEGEGFGAAAVRAVISGMYLVLKPPHPLKTHSDIATAARWLLEQTSDAPASISASELVSAVAQARSGS